MLRHFYMTLRESNCINIHCFLEKYNQDKSPNKFKYLNQLEVAYENGTGFKMSPIAEWRLMWSLVE